VQSKPLDLPKAFHTMVDIGHHVVDIMGIQDSRKKSDKNGGYITHQVLGEVFLGKCNM